MSGNTSASGGPLLPLASGPAPLENAALFSLLQSWVVGITGLAGQYVRPRYNEEPDNLPNEGSCWCAIGIAQRPHHSFPAVMHDPTGNNGLGQDILSRQQTLDFLASFYDLGFTGVADQYADLLSDGALILQNRELLLAQGFDVSDVGDPVVVPVLTKQRWLYRVDLPITLTRMIVRAYPVDNVLSMDGTLVVQSPDSTVTDQLTVTSGTSS